MMTRGFTLLEMLLSIAALGVIAGIGTPIYQSFQNRNDLDIAATTLTEAVRQAALHARAVDGDTVWGVNVATSTVTIFKGLTYATRDATVDELYPISGSITIGGTQEYRFSKLTGLPQAVGTTTLTSVNGETRTIALNAKGTVQY